jgi:hypothetical protein
MSENEAVDTRTKAWNELFRAARKCRDFMLEDNGNTRMVDPNDTWLAYMIGRMDDIIGHWDPDCTIEEQRLADEATRMFGGRSKRMRMGGDRREEGGQ